MWIPADVKAILSQTLLISLVIFLYRYIDTIARVVGEETIKLLKLNKQYWFPVMSKIFYFSFLFILIFIAVYLSNQLFPPPARWG